MNKIILVGRLGKDPEVRFTTTGTALCKFSLATSEKWTDHDGQRQERTTWHNIVVWGKLAEICGQYLQKGRQAGVVGAIQHREYDDRDGTKRWITEVTAREVEFLGGKNGEGAPDTEAHTHAPSGEDQQPREPPAAGDDDDLPF